MGQLYRARDKKVGRDVAIKILPDAFASDRDRLARFQREHVLASLNHPHIAAIYGLEDAGGVKALVMELVDGGLAVGLRDELSYHVAHTGEHAGFYSKLLYGPRSGCRRTADLDFSL